MATEVFNRYEHKYLIDFETYEKIRGVLERHMHLDAYNRGGHPYEIRNIYFDTRDDFLIRRSLESPPYKEKLRLRSYGEPNDDSMVYLEIKKKFNKIVNKRRSALKMCDAKFFLKELALPPLKEYMNKQVMQEIQYFISVYDVSPKLYLEYFRIAYFEEKNPDLRISFDYNIRARRNNLDLATPGGEGLLPGGTGMLMEIKTARAKPIWLCDMLGEIKIYRTSFSKYGTEYKKTAAKAI